MEESSKYFLDLHDKVEKNGTKTFENVEVMFDSDKDEFSPRFRVKYGIMLDTDTTLTIFIQITDKKHRKVLLNKWFGLPRHWKEKDVQWSCNMMRWAIIDGLVALEGDILNSIRKAERALTAAKLYGNFPYKEEE